MNQTLIGSCKQNGSEEGSSKNIFKFYFQEIKPI